MMTSSTERPGLRRRLNAFFFGFGQAFNVSGTAVNRGRYARGVAGDAQALAGDWGRSLARGAAMRASSSRRMEA